MRLSTRFLVLAAALSATARAVDVDADREINDLADLQVDNLTFVGNPTLTIDLRNSLGAPIDATLNAPLRDDGQRLGTFVKTGGGTLQYNGFSNLVYFANRSFDPLLATPVPQDLRPGDTAGAGRGFGGLVLIEQGQLQISGYLNQWADYGPFAAALKGTAGAEMLGASAIVVEGGAKLSFRNSPRNLVGASANLEDTNHDNPATPLVARLNFAHNLLAATTSAVETGPTTDHILVLHADFAAVGIPVAEATLGILEGRGRFYKTGADALRVTNAATFDGEFISAGGRLILDAATGDTLLSAQSVNLASGSSGTNVAFDISDDPDISHWKPGYAPAGQDNTLVVNGTQRIRNFQSLFGEGGFTSIVPSGTGGGNFVELALATDILRVNQQEGFDGYFTGSVVGAADEVTGVRGAALGAFVKEGEGALALFSVGNNMSLLEIRAGRVISNVQSLGDGVVDISGTGTLSIVQNDAGALRAVIRGASANAELRFKPTDSIRYRGGNAVGLGNADAGVADIVAAQDEFFGQVIVEDGNAIVFSSGNNNAFEQASRIRLLGGPSGRETSIRFNDTDQRFRNLEGDAGTRIYLGRGNITVVSAVVTSYAGGISGVGNLLKEGAPSFALSGQSGHFGATVVREGALTAGALGVANTSGVVVVGSSSFSGAGAQSVGGLFGQAGAVVTSAGNLTVGVSDELRGRLASELANLPPAVTVTSPAYYLATETTDVVAGFSPATTLGFLVRQYGLATDVGGTPGVVDDSDIVAYLDADDSGATTLAELSASDIEANRDLLAFSGTLNLGAGLTKVGAERLRLIGTVNFTAATPAARVVDIQGGTLDVAVGVLAGATSVNIGAAGTYALRVAAAATQTTPLSGSGTFLKLGVGRLDLDAAGTRFTGLYDVSEGTLAVSFSAGDTPGVSQQGDVATALGATFIAKAASNLSWAGEVYGDGTFVKQGAGVLTLTDGLIFHSGLTDVQQGGLVVAATPAGDLTLAAGTTYTAALVEDDFYDAVLSGAGTFVKSGDFDLRLDAAQPFAGTFNVTAGSLGLFAANALQSAQSVNFSPDTTLRVLGGLTQTLANVTADSSVTVEVETSGTDLTLFAGTGATNAFSARILGFPDIVKTGPGKLSFLRPDDSPNEIDTVDIQGGELEATRAGLGGADINVGAGATLRFFAAEGVTDVYTLAITGTGSIAKSGAGTVDLRDADLSDIGTSFDISAGSLIVSEDALGAGTVPTATLAGSGNLTFLATSSAALSAANVTGSGSLTLGGYDAATPVITLQGNLAGTVGYTGLTGLVDGVTVELAPGLVALPGLSAADGTTLDAGANALVVTQSAAAEFAGDLLGSGSLVVKGTALLDFTGSGGDLSGYDGSVSVDGGKLGVSTDNAKALALANSATLVLSGGVATNYTAALAGTGATLELADGADIDISDAADLALTTLDDGAFSRVILRAGSSLSIALGDDSLDKSLVLEIAGGSLDLLLTEAESTLRLSQLASVTPVSGTVTLAGDPGVTNPKVSIVGDIAGDLVITDGAAGTLLGDVGGDILVSGDASLELGFATANLGVLVGGTITVEEGSSLSGKGSALSIVNAGTLSPGFSPGTIVVTDLVNSGDLSMELGASASDQILFSGTAALNDANTGRLVLSSYGAGSLFGIRHVILRDTNLANGSFIQSPVGTSARFSQVVTPSLTPVRTLLVYPSALQAPGESALASLAVDGEVAAYVVRARDDYAFSFLPAAYTQRIKDITQVDLVPSGPDLASSVLGAQFNDMGARLAVLGDAALQVAARNLLPYAQASLATGAVAGFRADADAVQRRLELRRFDLAGSSVLTNDWFVEAANAKYDVDGCTEARHTGALAGVVHELGFDGYWGYSLGVDKSDTEGASGSFKGNGFRLGAFGGFMNEDRTLALDFGLNLSSVSGDLNRSSLFGSANVADADARTVGAWVRLTGAAALTRSLSFTPFAQLETSRTSLGSLSESGQSDALSVADADLSQSALRAGFSLHHSWLSDGGAWRYRLSLEVAYSLQLAGDDLDLTSSIPGAGFGETTTAIGVLPGDGFSVAPTFTFGNSPDSSFNVGLRLDQASSGDATAIQFGYRRRF